VQKAYRRLQERGLIYSVTGKGTFVAEASKLQFVGILVHQQYMLETAAAPTHALLIHAFCQHLAALRLPVRILTDTGPISRTNASISGDVMSALEQGRPLGLITLGHYGTPSLYELARSRSFPVVGVGVASKQPTVRLNYDHFAIVGAAMRHLVERGITQPGLLWLDDDNTPAERLAYLEELERVATECGAELDPDWIIGVHQPTDWAGYHAFNHLCSLSRRPHGLVVLDDVIGQGVHMGVVARQLRVPDDMAIVVQTNHDSSIVFPQQWQQCGYNLGECGRMVVETLAKVLAGEKIQSDLKFPFKWHSAAAVSPWNNPNMSIQKDGRLAPLFRSRRQALETT
jgi:DNA-binding LacI/PurR family transcriptional regulator